MTKSRARRFHSACHAACLSEWAPVVEAPVAAPGPDWPALTEALVSFKDKPLGRRIKISEVADCTRSDEVPVVDLGEVDEMLSRYRRLKHREPKPEEDPTMDQLACLKDLLKPPNPSSYVDFGIWGPHGLRTQRALKHEGLVLASDGTLVRRETKGPPDFMTWKSCYAVFSTAMIMLDQVMPPDLEAYAELIEKFVMRYGHSCWPLIYQAETRMRREHMERIRRVVLRDHHTALERGLQSDFHPGYPWGTLYRRAVADTEYWADYLKEPCLMISARARSVDSYVQGDCPIAADASKHVATYGALGELDFESRGSKRPLAHPAAPTPKTPRQTTPPPPPRASAPSQPTGDASSRHTTNRYGNPICMAYQTGGCSGKGITCTADSNRRHLCCICLGPHPSGGPKPCTKSFSGFKPLIKPKNKGKVQ